MRCGLPAIPLCHQPANPLPLPPGKLSNLQEIFYLQYNSFSSPIPTELGNLVAMTSHFLLRSNSLTGAIPTELGKLDNMVSTLALSYDPLSSSLPTELGRLTKVIEAGVNITACPRAALSLPVYLLVVWVASLCYSIRSVQF